MHVARLHAVEAAGADRATAGLPLEAAQVDPRRCTRTSCSSAAQASSHGSPTTARVCGHGRKNTARSTADHDRRCSLLRGDVGQTGVDRRRRRVPRSARRPHRPASVPRHRRCRAGAEVDHASRAASPPPTVEAAVPDGRRQRGPPLGGPPLARAVGLGRRAARWTRSPAAGGRREAPDARSRRRCRGRRRCGRGCR